MEKIWYLSFSTKLNLLNIIFNKLNLLKKVNMKGKSMYYWEKKKLISVLITTSKSIS